MRVSLSVGIEKSCLTWVAANAKSLIDGHMIAIKDNICTLEEPTTCASAILKGFRSPYRATVVEKLLSAGAVIAGKTNLDEFGIGCASRNVMTASTLINSSQDPTR